MTLKDYTIKYKNPIIRSLQDVEKGHKLSFRNHNNIASVIAKGKVGNYIPNGNLDIINFIQAMACSTDILRNYMGVLKGINKIFDSVSSADNKILVDVPYYYKTIRAHFAKRYCNILNKIKTKKSLTVSEKKLCKNFKQLFNHNNTISDATFYRFILDNHRSIFENNSIVNLINNDPFSKTFENRIDSCINNLTDNYNFITTNFIFNEISLNNYLRINPSSDNVNIASAKSKNIEVLKQDYKIVNTNYIGTFEGLIVFNIPITTHDYNIIEETKRNIKEPYSCVFPIMSRVPVYYNNISVVSILNSRKIDVLSAHNITKSINDDYFDVYDIVKNSKYYESFYEYYAEHKSDEHLNKNIVFVVIKSPNGKFLYLPIEHVAKSMIFDTKDEAEEAKQKLLAKFLHFKNNITM